MRPALVEGAQRTQTPAAALICTLFLLNLPSSLIEIPDCLPIVGSLDEVAATVVLMRCLARLGFRALPR